MSEQNPLNPIHDPSAIAGNVDASTERMEAIADLHQTFDGIITGSLEEAVPGYEPDRSFDGYSDPYVKRDNRWDPPTITFKVDSRDYGRPSAGITRDELELEPARGGRSGQDKLIEQITSKQPTGTIFDLQPSEKDSTRADVTGQYVFVRDAEGAVDMLRLPAHLASSELEDEMLKTVYMKMRSPNTEEAPWLTPELVKEVFGSKMQPASTEEIRAVGDKLQQLITDYPKRVAHLMEQSEISRAEYERSKTVRGKLGRLAGGR